jgi:hypothetical protein
MAHPRATGAARTIRVAGPRQARVRDLLYKADHPRRIDTYIDFFGDGAARPEEVDCCGDLLLGSFA